MTYPPAARTGARRPGATLVAFLTVVVAVLVGVTASRLLVADGSSTLVTAPGSPARQEPGDGWDHARPPLRDDGSGRAGRQLLDGATPAVAHLDPALLRALRRAATAAAADGVELELNSGWRSPEQQAELLRDAIAKYGSEAEAARWVATPETSAHVSGDAVDIGPSEGAEWLSRRGAGYGLCQIYDNEPWHFELRPDAVDDGCPARFANPTHDPRMRR